MTSGPPVAPSPHRADSAGTRRSPLARRLTTVLFTLAGAALLAWLVSRSHPAQLWVLVRQAAPWLPALFLIEGVRIGVEAWGERRLYEGRMPYPTLLRATIVAYSVAALLPGGRAAGEAVKAGMLRARSRLEDTAAAATTIETSSLVVLCAASFLIAVAALSASAVLAGALAVQGCLVGIGALFVAGIARSRGLVKLVARRWPRIAARLDAVSGRARATHLARPIAAFAVSRALQVVEYGLLFYLVTRRVSLSAAVLSFGVATLAGTVGDSVPVQIGVLEGAFASVQHALGLSPSGALAIALLAHGPQIAWALVGLVLPLVWRARARAREATPPYPD
ncbi:MAG TPA: lysylphosphatidylglycerol synthase transmembrane domain-containing protein [Polyangiaceae bacterium]